MRSFSHPAAKREGGRLSNHQRAMHEELRACGHTVIVGTAAEAIAHMEWVLGVPAAGLLPEKDTP